MNIRIDRPSLNRGSAEENMAVLDRWVADTADKLNNFASQINTAMAAIDAHNGLTSANEQSLAREIAALSDRIKALEEKGDTE